MASILPAVRNSAATELSKFRPGDGRAEEFEGSGGFVLTGQQNRLLLVVILALTVIASFISFNKKIRTYFGLDIRGGVRVTLRPNIPEYEKHGRKWAANDLETVRNILEKRVNIAGVSEPVLITKPESNEIFVELPDLKDEQEAVDRLQSTASLQFYLLQQLGKDEGGGIWKTITDEKTGEEILYKSDGTKLTDAELQEQVFDKPPIAAGADMAANSCRAEISPTGKVYITFGFDAAKDGSKNFEETTRVHTGERLAVFLDKKLLTAPRINSVISGNGIIEGNFTLESAKALADQLNAGALPVPLEILSKQKLEATLGLEAVKATSIAGGVGLLLVLLFMMVYYRLPGVLASVALILYALFSFSLFKLVPVTLTLPGIAGFILSIGMAVDANILIFERLKEELRSGKSLRNSIETGFKRAFTAILDSNVCTLITCGVLWAFGTGPIKGFALTLALGVAVSMFTAITVTRTFLFALVGMKRAQNPAVYGLDWNWQPKMGVMKRQMLWLGISGVIIIPGLIAWAMGGIKQSIDFKGGTELQIPFAARRSAEDIQKQLTAISPRYRDSHVLVSSGAGTDKNLALITMPQLKDDERVEAISKLTNNGSDLAPGITVKNIAYANVTGTISNELTADAFKAVILASILIVLYLALRFSIGGFVEGLKYGTCAVIALLHDVLVLWGAFAILGLIFNWQIDSLFVTAMLTVIGFSVHDTIIVFDRIRENLQLRKKGENFSDLADHSIEQTIARSVNTSLTVIITLFALFFFGGGVIHQFVGALLIGIISGTYSSIFNASVLLVLWKKYDTGLALAGYGSAAGLKSGLVARTASLPGDKPLYIPKSDAPATLTSSNEAGDSGGDDKPEKPRKLTQRRQRKM